MVVRALATIATKRAATLQCAKTFTNAIARRVQPAVNHSAVRSRFRQDGTVFAARPALRLYSSKDADGNDVQSVSNGPQPAMPANEEEKSLISKQLEDLKAKELQLRAKESFFNEFLSKWLESASFSQGAASKERRFNAFIAALKAHPELEMGSVLQLDCDEDALQQVGWSGPFLLRKSYQELWDTILSDYKERKRFSDQVIITGTAGIGKSAFRFFLLRKFLLGQLGFDTENVVFNFAESYFHINRQGVAKLVQKEICDDVCALGLFDPCSLLGGSKEPICKLTVMTTSPSPLVGQHNKPNLGEREKVASVHVLLPMTEEELENVYPDYDRDRLAKFSYGTRYCIARWFYYHESAISSKLRDACDNGENRKALADFFLNNRMPSVRDTNLPYRLCKIEMTERGWAATGFISDFVANRAADSVLEYMDLDSLRAKTLAMFENPFTQQLVGKMFENWVFERLGNRVKLIIDGWGDVTFTSLSAFDWRWNSKGQTMIMPSTLPVAEGVLYRAQSPTFPSIDGYAVVKGCLILVNVAMGKSHDSAEWKHIQYIVAEANKVRPTKTVVMVYITEKGNITKFVVPSCPTLTNHAIVCVGYLDIDKEFRLDLEARASFSGSRH